VSSNSCVKVLIVSRVKILLGVRIHIRIPLFLTLYLHFLFPLSFEYGFGSEKEYFLFIIKKMIPIKGICNNKKIILGFYIIGYYSSSCYKDCHLH
jgi:hypothetical protein